MPGTKLRQITGKVIHQGAEVLVLYKVNGKYYPAVDYNVDIMDAYFRTGNRQLLTALKYEMEA